MIYFETERLICKSDLCLENGKLVEDKKDNTIDILSIKPTTGKEGGFVFYHKKLSTVLICHVGITYARGRFEVTYGVDNELFRNQGYMTEALMALCKWLFNNTEQEKIWALPNGEYREASIRVLEKCTFTTSYTVNGLIWYELRKE
jgi:RimJ/RimL family protein N-acetyltransferase